MKKHPSRVPFVQPQRGGSVALPKATGGKVGSSPKTKKSGKIAPKVKSIEGMVAFRKNKYGS